MYALTAFIWLNLREANWVKQLVLSTLVNSSHMTIYTS